jgi:hypothetical protein
MRLVYPVRAPRAHAGDPPHFAAVGASLRLRAGVVEQGLGGVPILLAALAFVLLLSWVLPEPDENETIIRAWGTVSLAAVAASHARIVTAARRPTDSQAVSLIAHLPRPTEPRRVPPRNWLGTCSRPSTASKP